MKIINNKFVFRCLTKVRDMLFSLLGLNKLKGDIADLLWCIHKLEMSRMDSYRNEILFEMKYSQKSVPHTQHVETRIVNKQKFDTMVQMNELVLNIGSGHKGSDQMLNVDIRELPNVDIVADATDIRLPKGIAQGVFSSHVLEHFPHENLRRVVLLNWVGLLCEGGFFRAVVPDAEAMMAAFTRGDMSFDDLRTVTFGLQEYNGDIHYTMFSKDSLKLLLEEAGLHDIRYVATSRRNGLCLEMEVLAYK